MRADLKMVGLRPDRSKYELDEYTRAPRPKNIINISDF